MLHSLSSPTYGFSGAGAGSPGGGAFDAGTAGASSSELLLLSGTSAAACASRRRLSSASALVLSCIARKSCIETGAVDASRAACCGLTGGVGGDAMGDGAGVMNCISDGVVGDGCCVLSSLRRSCCSRANLVPSRI